MVKLNKEQLKAADTIKGNLLIIASAGTGKTTTIVERYVNLVEKHGYKPNEILMTTFTNKAAKDMTKKIKSRTNKIPPHIGTMHSIFLRILRNHSRLVLPTINFTIVDDPDKKKIIKLILIDKGIDSKSDNVTYLLRNISKFKNRGISSDYLEGSIGTDNEEKIEEITDDEILLINAKLKAELPKIYKQYDDYLRKHNMIDLDDILLLTFMLLDNHKKIKDEYKKQFKIIMVDEAQDLNFVQMRILNLLQNDNLCLIGDDCQNIYEWRGSSNDLVFKFNKHFNTVTLKDNFRSTETIILAINKVIESMKFRIEKELICTRGKGTKINIEPFHSFEDEIQFLSSEVKNLLKQKVNEGDIAILFRTNNIGKAIEREFLINKIPCHLSKSKNFFDRKEIKDILSFLKLKINNTARLDFERVLFLLEGFGKAKLSKIERIAQQHKCPIVDSLKYISELNLKQEIKTKLNNFNAIISDNKINPIKSFLNFFNYDKMLSKKYRDDVKKIEDKLANINVIIELFKGYKYDKEGIRSFLDSLIDIGKNEKDNKKVTLSTIHSAKGLEWKYVFLACCNDGILPLYKRNLSNLMRDSELRLFYVAISRTKDFLTISHNSFNGWKETDPSEFLDIIG